MLKSYKYRIYPTKNQEILPNKYLGSVRFLYNLILQTKKESWRSGVSLPRYELSRQTKDLKEGLIGKYFVFIPVKTIQQPPPKPEVSESNTIGSKMVKNHKLSKSISDASWSSFVRILGYIADWYSVNIMKIGRFTHSKCGKFNQKLELEDRIWTCNRYNTTLDRNLNAVINIKLFSLNNLSGGPRLVNHRELPSVERVKTYKIS